MAEILDDVAYLSQEIGPRPAGTEEEQQAALFVADQAHKRSNLKAEIEDIKCNANAWMVDLIYFGIAFLAVLLSMATPAISALTLVISIVCTAGFLCEERFNRPLLSKWLSKDISQNVVVKYRPTAAERSGSRRKVIVVANYDSGRVMKDVRPGLLGVWSKLYHAADIAMIAAPIILFFKDVVFLHALGFVAGFFTILAIIDAVLLLVPVIRSLIRRSGAYNEAANVNASGIAVLLNLIHRVGNSEDILPVEEEPEVSDTQRPVVHGAAEARAAGVVPEGADLKYEPDVSKAPVTGTEAEVAGADISSEPAATAPVEEQVPVPKPNAAPRTAPSPAPAAAPVAAQPARAPQEAVEKEPASVPVGVAAATQSAPEAPVEEEKVEAAPEEHVAAEAEPVEEVEAFGQLDMEETVDEVNARPAAPAPVVEEPEEQQSAADRLRAAKAAIAALTGEPVDETIYAEGISEEAPAVEEKPIEIPDEAGQERMRSEMMSALGGPHVKEAVREANAEAQVAETPAETESHTDTPAVSEEAENVPAQPAKEERRTPAPIRTSYAMPADASTVNKPAVPDWYRSAQEKAKRPETPPSKVSRSRYADALDSAVKESSAIFNEANQLLDEETETRLRNMRRGISEIKAPRVPEQDIVEEPVQASVQQPASQEPIEAETAVTETSVSETPETQQAPVQQPAQQAVISDEEPTREPVAGTRSAQVEAPETPIAETAVPDSETASTSTEAVSAEQEAIPSEAEPQSTKPMPVIVEEPVSRETISATEVSFSAGNEVQTESDRDVVAPSADQDAVESPAEQPAVPTDQDETPAAMADVATVEDAAPISAAPAIETQIPSLQPKGQNQTNAAPADEGAKQNGESEGSHKVIASNPNLGQTVAMEPIQMPSSNVGSQDASATAPSAPGQPRVTLPKIPSTNMAPIADTAKQRAPLAEATEEGGKTAAKSLLSHTIPKIDVASLSGDLGKPISADGDQESVADKRQSLMQNLPSLSGSITSEPSLMAEKQDKVVSATGSFAAVGATGAFKPVGDELVADVDPDDRYVEDADDSIQEGGITESGAFAAPDYVAMPKTRRARFFDHFRRKKNKQDNEVSPQEWLDVNDDFDARTVGRERGDWQSFQEGDARAHTADRQHDDAYDEYADDVRYDGYEPYDANDGEIPNGAYDDDGYYAESDAYQPEEYYGDDTYFEEGDYAESAEQEAPVEEQPNEERDADDSDGQKWQGGAFSGERTSARRTEVYREDDGYDAADDASEGRGSRSGRLQGVMGRIKDSASSAGNAARSRTRRAQDDEPPTDHASVRRGDHPSRSRANQRTSSGRVQRSSANEPIRTPRVTQEMREIYQFADDSLDTEVWFVALGAQQESDNAGLKQFIDAHREDLRGAIIVSLEGMGSGVLGYGNIEGVFKKHAPSTRLKRFLHTASQATGISLVQSDQTWRDSAASVAMGAGLQAVSIMGLDGNKPAYYGQADDVLENIDEEMIKQNANFVMEFLKAI
ncbi:MAG: hypothetical protein ACOX1O_00330 [Eggerthellaceae bacterium]|jgi:hypothetical protein